MKFKQRSAEDRAAIDAIRQAHYAREAGEAPTDEPKKKGGRPKKVETATVDVTTFNDAEPVTAEVPVE